MGITQLPSSPNVDGSVSMSLWKWLIEMGNRMRQIIPWINDGHASTHAKTGSDALDPASIGAAVAVQEPWQTPVLLNGWVNLGGGWSIAGYFKDSLGMVHLRGTLAAGTIGAAFFTLPTGYRPLYSQIYPSCANGAYALVDVYSGGVVTCVLGSANNYVTLDGITFRAEA